MTHIISNSFKHNKNKKEESYVWLCLCPHCHNEIYLPKNIPFLTERYKCPKCKKIFTGVSMRGLAELVVTSGGETVTAAIIRKGRW